MTGVEAGEGRGEGRFAAMTTAMTSFPRLWRQASASTGHLRETFRFSSEQPDKRDDG
jgi:hypothetical protein